MMINDGVISFIIGMPFIRWQGAIHPPVKNAILPLDRMPFM